MKTKVSPSGLEDKNRGQSHLAKELGQNKNNLSKVEGILTSPLQIKWPREGNPYYLGFFQLERSSEVFDKASQGLEQDIPIIFKLATPCLDCENAKTICQMIRGQHNKSKCEECRETHTEENWAENKPDMPPRAKVLLEGKWAESLTSPRPSFTCLAWEILSNPPPPTIKSLREQISSLLKTSLEKQSEWKKRTDYLFQRIDYLNDLQKLTKLGDRYLAAYLLLKSADYANYQDNLLPHTVNLVYFEEYLAKIQSEIEDIAYQIRAYQSKQI